MADFDQIIHLNVELEGLLKVLRDRDSIEARALLSRKFSDFSRMINDLLQADKEATYVEVKDQEAVSDEVVPEMEAATQAIERGQHQEHSPQPEAPAQTLGDTIHATTLASAFTLNDKFRFVRDVFNGNEADFTETVNVLSEMSSYKEAYQYIVDDLQLDPDAPAVADFIDIVARFF